MKKCPIVAGNRIVKRHLGNSSVVAGEHATDCDTVAGQVVYGPLLNVVFLSHYFFQYSYLIEKEFTLLSTVLH